MQKVIYPGSFDPPTLGHLNIAKRAAAHFDQLIVAIGENSKKSPLLDKETRVHLFQEMVKENKSIQVVSFQGLLVDFAKREGATLIVRAIRTVSDFEYEQMQAEMNRHLSGIDTFYLVVEEKYRWISSTLVREIALQGGELSEFVSPGVKQVLLKSLPKSQRSPILP
jgi:pantetheine-phosphate adenylyltransferase